MEKLVLIDGNSLINRAFYAMPLLSTKNGVYTNAVYGFMNMFFKMLGDIKPKYVAVAFDVHHPTFRHKLFPEYKGKRKPSPPELHPQIQMLKDLLRLMGVCVIEQAGIEADDIIGTIAKHTKIQTIIFTGDKDSFQLVDEETEVHFTKRGITDVEIYDNANFHDKTGIDPYQIIELKALMGDASDNIPGVPGVGEKTAIELLQTYGNVDTIYEHISEIKGKLKEKLENGKESCYLSKTLATININCDIDTDTEKMHVPEKFSGEIKKKFTELEFKSLYSRSDIFFDEKGQTALNDDAFSLAYEVKKIDNLSELKEINFTEGSLVITDSSFNLFDGKTEYVIQFIEDVTKTGFATNGFFAVDVANAICSLLDENKKVIVYSNKEVRHFLYDKFNIDLKCKIEDLSLIKYLVDFSGKEETLNEVFIEYGKNEKTPAISLYEIYLKLSKKLTADNLEKLYREIELPLSNVLFNMENAGFKVDIDALKLAKEKYQEDLSKTENEIKELANDQALNINSPKQLGELLFIKLKVGKGKKTKTGYSTSAEVLEGLKDTHPIIPLILHYRKIQKLQSTYIEGFLQLIDKKTGIIKTCFNQTATSTGRLSSKEPNLQNIPVRDEEGKELRKCFVPRNEDGILIGADYSQIELRLLAAFSGAKGLIKAFNDGIDVHTATASKVFNVPTEKVSDTMRRNAKAVNFGIIYGMSEYGLSKSINTTAEEAKKYIESYFKQYPEVKEYMNKNVEFARKTGYSTTMLGRKRYIREINSTNYQLRQFGERVSMNMPLQGSAADVIKLAMLGVYNRLKKENLKSQLILQIHDELIIDAYISEKAQVEKILVEEMENAVSLSVPLTVEKGCGKTWFDAK